MIFLLVFFLAVLSKILFASIWEKLMGVVRVTEGEPGRGQCFCRSIWAESGCLWVWVGVV